ncbi:AAA-like domain-containing protein [Leptolyngbya sp. FACHB-711]|uniref:AAA-like domain-containing protein n=1 Tax=Leptolyngbya sp. FACHB-711 TaxID=2692813 RepID=UPI001685F52A|nr:AAA-like domain-containing protein [Leptolyngbya sp. FACHB-711]
MSKQISAICKAFDEEFIQQGESLRLSNDKGESYRLRDELIELFVRYDPNNPHLNPELLKHRSIALEEPDYPVSLESGFYIERPPLETRCCEAIKKPGALLRIRAPKQMGKSSLLSRVLDEAVNQGRQVVAWSLSELDRDLLDSLEPFLRSFCWEMSRQLDLESSEIEAMIADVWNPGSSQKMNCSRYFEKHLLPRIDGSLVLALDDVDCLFSQQILAAEFFTMLRKWHEDGIHQKRDWGKLRFVELCSEVVYKQRGKKRRILLDKQKKDQTRIHHE